jgi:hypothetical protein
MKKPLDYKPQFSLSIKYLRMIMSTREYNNLLKRYVEKKLQYWGKDKN